MADRTSPRVARGIETPRWRTTTPCLILLPVGFA